MDGVIVDEIDGVKLVRINHKNKKVKIVGTEDTSEDPDDSFFKVEQKFLKERRPIWTDEEIHELIKIMKEKNIMPLLNGRQYRRADVFKIISDNLQKRGYKRTPDQVQIKWKHLRLCYFRTKAKFSKISERKHEFAFYEEVDELFGGGGGGLSQPLFGIDQMNEILKRIPKHALAQIDGSKFFDSSTESMKVPSREEIYQARESSITYALESFTKNWQAMVLRVAEKEMEQDKKDKEREQRELRIWEERLIEKQCAAMSKTNQEFLAGLKDIFEGLKK